MSLRPTRAERSADVYGAAEELHRAAESVDEALHLVRRASARTSFGPLGQLARSLRSNATTLERAADELLEEAP